MWRRFASTALVAAFEATRAQPVGVDILPNEPESPRAAQSPRPIGLSAVCERGNAPPPARSFFHMARKQLMYRPETPEGERSIAQGR